MDSWKYQSIKSLKLNEKNPRIIQDSRFDDLVKSIKEFPKMLELRPIVINSESVVLGGNMRLKACIKAGLKKVPVIQAADLTAEQQREFVIKDNVAFGEWDWETIQSEWPKAEEWGLNIPDWESTGIVDEVNKGDINSEWVGLPDIEKLNPGIHVSRLYFIFDTEIERDQWLYNNKIRDGSIKKTAQGWIVNYSTQYT